MKNLTLVIMAAGASSRFCDDSKHIANNPCVNNKNISTRKQWLRLGITPLWLYVTQNLTLQILETINLMSNKYNKYIKLEKIIITSSTIDIKYMSKLIERYLEFYIKEELIKIPTQIVMGGDSRFQSLKNAIKEVNSEYVIVSDCARFNTSKDVLQKMFMLFIDDYYDCIVPYLQITDTTLICDNNFYNIIDREKLRLIQTPQITNTNKLIESFNKNINFSDESSAICALDNPKIGFVAGSKDMAKLTYQDDIYLLKRFYNANPYYRKNDTLIGHGSDIHGFIDSKDMYLCGVKIESEQGFKAHSDGDVGIHAIIDSILGAMNYGDIGELFPDSNDIYKNIDSKILLKEVYDYCLSTGLEIINLDITIIAQTPKISPYKTQMQEMLAHILYLPKMRVNIKASTAEGLGFIGRKEGVLAQSVVQLKARKLD